MNFRCKFRHRRLIRRPRFPVRVQNFGDLATFSVDFCIFYAQCPPYFYFRVCLTYWPRKYTTRVDPHGDNSHQVWSWYRGLTVRTHYVQICHTTVIASIMSSTSNSTGQKFPVSIFTFLSPFLRDQKFSLLHSLRYWRFPFVQERTDWRDAAARLSSVSRKAIGALVHYGLLMLRGLTRPTVL